MGVVSVKSEMARPALVEDGVGRRFGGYIGRDGEAGAREGLGSASGCRCESEAASPRGARVVPNSDVVAMICERDGEAGPNRGSLSRWRWPF